MSECADSPTVHDVVASKLVITIITIAIAIIIAIMLALTRLTTQRDALASSFARPNSSLSLCLSLQNSLSFTYHLFALFCIDQLTTPTRLRFQSEPYVSSGFTSIALALAVAVALPLALSIALALALALALAPALALALGFRSQFRQRRSMVLDASSNKQQEPNSSELGVARCYTEPS